MIDVAGGVAASHRRMYLRLLGNKRTRQPALFHRFFTLACVYGGQAFCVEASDERTSPDN
jgi:hypothetical protein